MYALRKSICKLSQIFIFSCNLYRGHRSSCTVLEISDHLPAASRFNLINCIHLNSIIIKWTYKSRFNFKVSKSVTRTHNNNPDVFNSTEMQHSFYCMLSTVCPRCLSSLIHHLLVCTGTSRSCDVTLMRLGCSAVGLGSLGLRYVGRARGEILMWTAAYVASHVMSTGIRGAANTYRREVGQAFLACALCVVHFTCVCVLACVSTNVRVWCAPVYAHECIVCA